MANTYTTPEEKSAAFYTELKALLLKYNAELQLEDIGMHFTSDDIMIVDFAWDPILAESCESGVGTPPQIRLGKYVTGTY